MILVMRWYQRYLLPGLRLIRLPLVFAPLANVWLMVFLARYLEQPAHRSAALSDWGLAGGLGWSVPVVLGLHIYATTLNDLLDIRHDRLFRPDRPLPAGWLGVRQVLPVCLAGLLVAVLCSLALGSWSLLVTGAMGILVLFYNAIGKYLGAVGLASLGLMVVLMMLLPNPPAAFLWPVWMNFAHLSLVLTLAYVWEGKRPRLTAGHWWLLWGWWIFLTLVLFGWIRWREVPTVGWEASAVGVSSRVELWMVPAAATVLFAGLVLAMYLWTRRGERFRRRRRAGAVLGFVGVVWMIVYDAGWLLGLRRWVPALVLLGLVPLSLGLHLWLRPREE